MQYTYNGSMWSTVWDINIPQGKILKICGSCGISGKYVDDMIDFIKGRLKNNGHKLSIKINI